MLRTEKLFFKILFAALPVLAVTTCFGEALYVAAAACSVYWFVALFFKLTWSFFPRRMLGFSMTLFLVFLGSLGWSFMGKAPYWLASVYLLGPLEFSEKRKIGKPTLNKNRSKIISHRLPEIFLRGTGFILLMVLLGAGQEFLGRRLEVPLFHHPAGVLFLLGMLTLFASRQPSSNEPEATGA